MVRRRAYEVPREMMEKIIFPEIYFWEPELSPHKVPLFNQLTTDERVGKAVYIAERPLGEHRRKQGWAASVPHHYVEAPSEMQVEQLVSNSDPNAVHIFSGLRRVPCIVNGQTHAIRAKRRFGIFQEPRVLEGIRGKVRLVESWLTEQHLRGHADFVLAVGAHGPRWFRLTGYRKEIIFPFAYFLDPGEAVERRNGSTSAIGYVGRLQKSKGFSIFLAALRHMPEGVEVHIAGSGALEAQIAAAQASSAARIVFHGVVPMADVGALFDELDVLVLPSITTDDGWGAVVSEALFHGAYPITSALVGASICLKSPEIGAVVPPKSAQALAASIQAALKGPYLGTPARGKRSRWARDHISARAGKEYLLAVLEHLYFSAKRPAGFLEHA